MNRKDRTHGIDEPLVEENESAGRAQVLDDRWMGMIDAALKVQNPLAKSYVARLRAKKPHATREELLNDVSKKFVSLMTATGAGVGGVAALPGVGTITAIGLTVGEGVSFAEACAFLVLATASIHDVDMTDPNRRRLVMMGVLGGERGEKIVEKALGRQGASWDTVLAGGTSSMVPSIVSQQVTRYLRRRIMARVGGMWAGRLIPFGIGAVIGGFGSRAISRSVVEAVRDIFHDAPVVDGGGKGTIES